MYYFRFLPMISSALFTDFEHFMRFCDLPMLILSVAFIGPILNAAVTAVCDSCLPKNLNLLNILCVTSVPKDGMMLTYHKHTLTFWKELGNYWKCVISTQLFMGFFTFLRKPHRLVEMGTCSSRWMVIKKDAHVMF